MRQATRDRSRGHHPPGLSESKAPGDKTHYGDFDVQESFVILEFDVEFGLLLLDQITLQEKGFQFIIGDDVIQVVDVLPQDLGFFIEIPRGSKIGTDTVLETLGLANVDHFPAWVLEKIDSRLIGKGIQLFLQHSSIIKQMHQF